MSHRETIRAKMAIVMRISRGLDDLLMMPDAFIIGEAESDSV